MGRRVAIQSVESGSSKDDSIVSVAGSEGVAGGCDAGDKSGVDGGASEDAIGDTSSRDVFVFGVRLTVSSALSSLMGFDARRDRVNLSLD